MGGELVWCKRLEVVVRTSYLLILLTQSKHWKRGERRSHSVQNGTHLELESRFCACPDWVALCDLTDSLDLIVWFWGGCVECGTIEGLSDLLGE